ncbi:hypothetical protein L484_011037 [Morus notabilis]|uniref:Uncharacterized protein n=1 Tax=Morus notabilis TaxID=981085 RepID=W9RQN7_9ROSA|nr:hypothetical protein L484_011037 [Morus notabilis]
MSTRGGRTTGRGHDRGRGPDRGRGAARAGNLVDANLVAMIPELRELQDQQKEIHELRANGHGGVAQGENILDAPQQPQQQEEVATAAAASPVAEAAAMLVYQEPLLGRWRRVKLADFK